MSEAENTATGADPDPLISTILAGRYEIIALIARGYSSSVYLANHTLMGTQVALKVLTSLNTASFRRFHREARILYSLKHPNIVGISSFGSDEQRVFLVMDLIEGETLVDAIRKDPPSVEQAVQIAGQICSGLAYAHSHQVLHRDLNSANIMIEHNQAKILDFGLSKSLVADSNPQETTTGSGAFAGTPAYMSPEQCRGEELDKRSDIYSFACLFYELLAGHPPFQGETALATMEKQVNAPMPPLTVTASSQLIPKQLKKIIERCLSKERSLRYSSFEELISVQILARFVGNSWGSKKRP